MSTGQSAPPTLVVDVGGTNIRLSLSADGELHRAVTWPCSEHDSLHTAIGRYLDGPASGTHITRAVVAVAGPVGDDKIELTNQRWSFSIEQLRKDLGLDSLEVVNDFAGLAAAIPHLDDRDRKLLKQGAAEADAPIAVMGPGTGLGVSVVVPTVCGWQPVATEGGHRDLAATTEREWAVIRHLEQQFGRISCERVLSGPGLTNLYLAPCELEDQQPDESGPAAIVARAGSEPHQVEREVARLFSGWLGAFAGDLALTLGARGGVYLAGGVVQRMGSVFDLRAFNERFLDKGRFEDYLSPIPVWLVHNPYATLIGIAKQTGRGSPEQEPL